MNKKRSHHKYIFFYTSFFIMLIFTNISTFAQDSILNYPISIELNNTTIPNALKHIEKKIDYYFTYDNKIINKEKKIDLSIKNKSLKECLYILLNNHDLKYQIIDNHIIITINKKEEKIEITSIVLDKNTGKPLQFANVSLKKYNLGTITNDKGEFILKIPKKLINDELCVSYIGYKNFCANIEHLDSKKIIYLEENIISLQEIIIKRNNPLQIIKTAINKIKYNYFIQPIYLKSFYREYVKKRKDYMFFLESVLQVYKPSYLSESTGQIKVLKTRKMQNISKLDTISLKLKSGLQSSLHLDIVKNKIDFIDNDYLKFYNYKIIDIVSYNDEIVYAIEFTPKNINSVVIYSGILYISVDDLVIIGANFKVNTKNLQKVKNRFIVKKNRKLKLKIIDANYIVSYNHSNNKYYINHILASLKLKVKKKKKIFYTNFETSFEMAIINIDTNSVKKFKRKEKTKLNTVFLDDFTEYDETFWGNYNYIKPNETWQDAIKKLKK